MRSDSFRRFSNNDFVNPNVNHAAHDEIARQTEEFLARGGEITVLEVRTGPVEETLMHNGKPAVSWPNDTAKQFIVADDGEVWVSQPRACQLIGRAKGYMAMLQELRGFPRAKKLGRRSVISQSEIVAWAKTHEEFLGDDALVNADGWDDL